MNAMPYYPSPLSLHPSPLRSGLPSHHGVQLVETTTPDEMMALRAESIEHLDFAPEVPCESAWECTRLAAWYWRLSCHCREEVALCHWHSEEAERILSTYPEGGICPFCQRDVFGVRLGPVR